MLVAPTFFCNSKYEILKKLNNYFFSYLSVDFQVIKTHIKKILKKIRK